MAAKGEVLVTGADGRLGTAVVQALVRGKVRVRALCLPGQGVSRLKAMGVRAEGVDISDFSNFQRLRAACRGASAVLHLAGQVDYSAPDDELVRNNYLATSQLANAAVAEGVRRFVFVSSTSIYRGVSLGPGEHISESTLPLPANAYGRSKLAAENALRASPLEYVILRPPIVYGKGFREGFRQVVGRIRAGRMRLVGDGANSVSFIHVDDLARAVLLAMRTRAVREDFIVTSGESFTQRELFEAVANELAVEPPKKHVSKRMALLAARLDAWRSRLLGRKTRFPEEYLHTLSEHRQYDIGKARRLLRFSPRVKFASGLKRFIREISAAGG
ncbi:MAG: NAD-dependent epimerase/dehydratase family protein [Candidatus Micrarchaeota archaeon]